MLRLIQHHLEKAGFEMIQARNGQEAMAAMSQSPQLMVLNDQSLNSKSGSGQIPVIRMTDVPVGMQANKQATEGEIVLTRPFSPAQLVAEVKRLMTPVPVTVSTSSNYRIQ
jgi:DNA-binding response OmpR family regulator